MYVYLYTHPHVYTQISYKYLKMQIFMYVIHPKTLIILT